MTKEEIEEAIRRVSSPKITNFLPLGEGAYEIGLRGRKREWSVRIKFPESFPYRLPRAVLLNRDMIGLIAHVNKEGLICFEEGDSLWIDHTKPSEVITHFLENICSSLDRFSLSIYQDELRDEYEGYFLEPNKYNSVNSFYRAGEKVEQPRLMLHKKQGKRNIENTKPILLHPEGSTIPQYFSNAAVSERLVANTIIHLPLEKAVLPPSNAEDLTSDYIYDLKNCASEKNRKSLEKILKKKRPHYWAFVLISMPRTIGSRTQLLLRYSASESLPHPLLERNSEWRIDIFRLNQLTSEYLLERGGADYSLQNKHVAVIGCGSVGGEIAYMLAKSGCRMLTLIDDDYLEPNNIYRHRLGGLYLNFKPNGNGHVDANYKVNALKQSLLKDLPYVNVNVVAKRFNLRSKTILPDDVDMVVVAVGSPSENCQINRVLKHVGINRVVFCWNEASSIGGHAISLDLRHSCYECLHSEEGRLTPKTQVSLIEPGQTITKNLTGCAGVFSPFTYLDSVRTAEIATQLAINSMLNNEHSIARSWKGPNNSKISTTERYRQMPEQESIDLIRSAYCGLCNE